MHKHNQIPTVSIILPCYNMEKYLNRSIDSLLANDYKAKEIIIVNDGSTDSTSQIADALSSKYKEIRVIHQPNSGVSAARNSGINAATGKYIMFVDPDDYVTDNFISAAATRIEEKNADLVIFGYSTPWFSNPPIWKDYLPVKDYQCESNKKVIEDALPYFFGISAERFSWWIEGNARWHTEKDTPTIWRFIYNRHFLIENDLKFTPLKYGEDMIFIIECLTKANSLYSVNKSLYKYEPLRNGATVKSVSPEEVMTTKLLITKERHRIASDMEAKNMKSFLPLYAGSVAMASLQTAYGICDKLPYRVWKNFNQQVNLRSAMRCISTPWGGGKTLDTGRIAKI